MPENKKAKESKKIRVNIIPFPPSLTDPLPFPLTPLSLSPPHPL